VHVHLVPVTNHDEFIRGMSAHITNSKPYPYNPSADELQLIAEKINTEEK
jgi:hypothetical protein